MKIYIFEEYEAGVIGAYSTREKAIEEKRKCEDDFNDGESFDRDEYRIYAVELDAPSIDK